MSGMWSTFDSSRNAPIPQQCRDVCLFRGKNRIGRGRIVSDEPHRNPRETYMADPFGRPTHPFPLQHAHTPKKERDGGRTEDRLVQIHLTRITQTGQ